MITIQQLLEIEVTSHRNRFMADAKILTGSPQVGWGESPYEALYDLLAKILFQIGQPQRNGHAEQVLEKIRKFWNSSSNPI